MTTIGVGLGIASGSLFVSGEYVAAIGLFIASAGAWNWNWPAPKK